MNVTFVNSGQAKKQARLYLKVQEFWNESYGKPDACRIIGRLPFTRPSAARYLNLNSASVARYLEGLEGKKASPLLGKGILESREIQKE